MTHKPLCLTGLLFFMLAQVISAKEQIIEDFSEYASTEDLLENWNSFGSAASSGPATLEVGSGKSGSNAALYQLNWDAGDNANMRMKSLPEGLEDLSDYDILEVTLKLEADSMGYASTEYPTSVRFVIQGGPDGTIWQTDSNSKKTLKNDGYETLIFSLSDSEMSRESGDSTFEETISQLSNLRLRFENKKSENAREDAYIDSLAVK